MRTTGTVIVSALLIAACQAPGAADIHVDGDGREIEPVPIDLSVRGSVRSRSDLTCELIVDEREVDAFFESHGRAYLVVVSPDEVAPPGVFGVYDAQSDCAAECLAVCELRWVCSTLQCGARDGRDGDPNQTRDELEANGFPTPRRDPPPRPRDGDRDGDGRDDRFDSPSPGPRPGI